MFKQSPSRNQRSKGIKVKHILQICFLLVICFWLIYQVKHSHDKKKEFDESDLKNSQGIHSSSEVVRLGRKDLHPKLVETATTITKQDEEAEEENVGEEEEIKHEEEHAEDNKSEEKDDEGTGLGDDEVDEQEEEKFQAEEDHEEDVTEEDKEKEDGDGKENEEKDSEDSGGQLENDNPLEEHDDDDDDEKAHEAREEHYKADDASSAVTHETEIISGENVNGSSENSNQFAGVKVLENENVVNNTDKKNVGENTTNSKIEDRQMTETGSPANTTANEDIGNVGSKPDNSSLTSNSTLVGISTDHQEQMNKRTEASTAAHGLSTPNGETQSDASHAEKVTKEGTTSGDGSGLGKNSSLNSTYDQKADSNSKISTKLEDEESNSGEASKTYNSVLTIMPEKSVNSSLGDNSQSSTMESKNPQDKNPEESNDGTEGTDDDVLQTEDANQVQNESIDTSDSSIGLEEKEIRTDLETLPEIQTEGSNDEDAAAE